MIRGRIEAAHILRIQGVPCLEPRRALVDAVRWTDDFRERVVAIDMTLAARLVDHGDFRAYLAGLRSLPGLGLVRVATRLADPRSLSPGETRMRLIWVLDALLPVPRCNWPIADLAGHRLGTPDLLCDELAVAGEYDGAEHRKMARHARDVARESILRDAGLETFAVVGADVHRPGVAVERMQAAVRRAAESRRPRQWMIAVNPPLPSLTRTQ